MGYYRCIIEIFQGYVWITLIAYKIYIYINTPLLSHSDTPSINYSEKLFHFYKAHQPEVRFF